MSKHILTEQRLDEILRTLPSSVDRSVLLSHLAVVKAWYAHRDVPSSFEPSIVFVGTGGATGALSAARHESAKAVAQPPKAGDWGVRSASGAVRWYPSRSQARAARQDDETVVDGRQSA